MKKNLPPNTVIVTPFYQPWDRTADFQRQTCFRLAQTYQVVASLEYAGEFWLKRVLKLAWNWLRRQPAAATPTSAPPPTQPALHLNFTEPIYFFPGHRWPLIRRLNQSCWLFWLTLRWRWFGSKPGWLWLFDPEAWTYPTALPSWVGWKSLYDCVDDHSQLDPLETQRLLRQEKILIKTATLFTVNSQTLAHLHQADRRPDAIVVQGFDLSLWPKKLPPARLKAAAHPVVSLAGGLDEKVDWSLLYWLAKKLSTYQFLLAGPIAPLIAAAAQKCLDLPNVSYLGVLPRPQLAELYTQTTIGLIPYNVQLPTVRHAFPMKLFEYFAYGKPVVASPITELKYYPAWVTIAHSRAAWLTALHRLATHPWPASSQHAQRTAALTHTYENKLQQILNLMVN